MRAVKAMLFDLDGTLLHSAPELVDSLNFVRASMGMASLAAEEVGHASTRGIPGLLKAGMPETDKSTFQDWRRLLTDHYVGNGMCDSKLYDGVSELISTLVSEGIPWGIVTNRSEILTGPVLASTGLDETVSCVVCGDTLEKKKPHPEPVLLACERIGVDPADALFAGDDPRDVEAGQAAGTQTAAVFYGYGSSLFDGSVAERSIPVNHPSDLIPLVR
jgi:phosphoglycolate phosphatase